MWYKQGGQHCKWYGKYFAHAKVTANVACCACGGGEEVLTPQSATLLPQTTIPPTRGKNDTFIDTIQEGNITALREEDLNEETVLIEEGLSDVTPSIVGGTEVDPPRKYKVCCGVCLSVLWW